MTVEINSERFNIVMEKINPYNNVNLTIQDVNSYVMIEINEIEAQQIIAHLQKEFNL